MSNFDSAFEHILEVEGGYSNHPDDRGNETNMGVTIGQLSKWRGKKVSADDVKNLTEDEAKLIYKAYYWDKWQLDKVVSDKVALVLFDQCVNWGIGKSTVKRVQSALVNCGKKVDVDGVIGPQTIKAINSIDESEFIYRYVCLIQEGYVGIVKRNPSQMVFLLGWLRRTHKLMWLMV